MSDLRFNKSDADGVFLTHITNAFSEPSRLPDLTVVWNGKHWECHKIILCAHSEWFERACSGGFAESGQRTIELQEDDDRVMHAVLQYWYSHAYDVPDPEDVPTAIFHVRVFALAEKYLVKGLRDLATNAFATAAPTSTVEQLSQAITEAYTATTDPGHVLRSRVVSHVLGHRFSLLKTREAVFDKVMEDTPGFAAEVAQAMAKKEGKWYICPDNCRTKFIAAWHEDEEFTLFCSRLYRMNGKEWEAYATTVPPGVEYIP